MGMSMEMTAVGRRICSCGPCDDVIGCNGATILPCRNWMMRRITTTALWAIKSRGRKGSKETVDLCLIS